MSRFALVLFAMLSCATESQSPIPAGLAAWIDAWVDARACLVAEAENTETGVAIRMLTGRDCTKLVHQLDVRVVIDDNPLNTLWRGTIARTRKLDAQPSPVLRAIEIDQIDVLARQLGMEIGHPLPPPSTSAPLRVLPAPWRPFRRSDRPSVTGRFGAGFVHALEPDRYTIVDGIGAERSVAFSKRAMLALPSLEVMVSRRARVATAEGDDQVVVTSPRPGEEGAYALETTHDGGRHWRRDLISPGGELRGSWQDPRTGEIVLMVAQGLYTYAHRVTTRSTLPSVQISAAQHPWFDQLCHRDGHLWGLNAETLTPITGRWAIQLTGWGHNADLDCRGTTALVVRHEPDVLERCEETCAPVFSAPSSIRGAAALGDDGRWIYAAALERVVAVWREGTLEPRFFRLSSFDDLMAVAVVGGKPALVLGERDRDQRTSLVPLP